MSNRETSHLFIYVFWALFAFDFTQEGHEKKKKENRIGKNKTSDQFAKIDFILSVSVLKLTVANKLHEIILQTKTKNVKLS